MASKSSRRSRGRKSGSQWRRMDLHLHTPASSDYQHKDISYLDILRQAVVRGLDVIAFTDHNTVAGYSAMQREIEQLEWLAELERIEPGEQRRLDEYRRLLDKILVLPGFEFTATFGFHVLGIFAPDTPITFLEHLLLNLHVPPEALSAGSVTVGATSDVLTAYEQIDQAGGIVIAAHVNSSNGVLMRGLDFGGQTRIAYTQDRHLHALEVTDLEKRGRYTTRRFFDGSKPEYPRPMRCIQGSDAHRLTAKQNGGKNLGVGDRVTEVLLEEVSFEALYKVLTGTDFARTRPYRGPRKAVDFVQFAREEGESIVLSFHASIAQRGGHLDRILSDVCAMANSNGGTIYVGLSADAKEAVAGVRDPEAAIKRLRSAISSRFSPEPAIEIDSLLSQGKHIVRLSVPPGKELPYAIDQNRFYVRDESETSLAVRDEIVQLVMRGLPSDGRGDLREGQAAESTTEAPEPATLPVTAARPRETSVLEPPRTGVEIVSSEKRQGTIYHTVRDLRNGNLIKNVTRASSRKLWHYAITKTESGFPDKDKIRWHGNVAVLDYRTKGDHAWYDLAMRSDDKIRVYFGVTDSGLNDDWLALLPETAVQN